MKNELEKRKENKPLYEPIEPLFPDAPRMGRIRIIRAVAILLALAVLVCAWAVSASGKSDGGESGSFSGYFEPPTEGESFFETESATESETEEGSEGESFPEAEESEEESTGANGNEGDGFPDASGRGEVDISELERGLSYVINYSDKGADVVGLIERGFMYSAEAGKAEPQVLVIHTHTGEEYQRGDTGYRGPAGVVSVGDVLVSRLNSMGIGAVHCTVIHDGRGENAYRNVERTIRTMLEIYPSIRYVIDVHRMDLWEGEDPIKTVSGSSDRSAQIRLSVGAGDEWQDELSLALCLRKSLNGRGERICAPVVITPSLSDLDLGEFYIMADVGSIGNTVEEAMTAGERLARALASVLLE